MLLISEALREFFVDRSAVAHMEDKHASLWFNEVIDNPEAARPVVTQPSEFSGQQLPSLRNFSQVHESVLDLSFHIGREVTRNGGDFRRDFHVIDRSPRTPVPRAHS
jgi:hypothetical protein